MHAGQRGDGFDIPVELIEERPAPFGAFVAEDQPVFVVGDRVDQQHARLRVLGEVAYGLREELVRDRDPLVVDEVDAGQVRHVGRAVTRGGRDHGRDDALEARADRRQRDGCVARHVTRLPSSNERPAVRAGRLVEQLLDGHHQGEPLERAQHLEQLDGGAVGVVDRREEAVDVVVRTGQIGIGARFRSGRGAP